MGYISDMHTGRPGEKERTRFGERVAHVRELAALTQQQVADKLARANALSPTGNVSPSPCEPNSPRHRRRLSVSAVTIFWNGQTPSPRAPKGQWENRGSFFKQCPNFLASSRKKYFPCSSLLLTSTTKLRKHWRRTNWHAAAPL